MPQVSQDFFAKLYPLGLLIGLLYTNLRASTVLQKAGAVLWTALHSLQPVWLFTAPDRNGQHRTTPDRTGPVPGRKWLIISLPRLLRVELRRNSEPTVLGLQPYKQETLNTSVTNSSQASTRVHFFSQLRIISASYAFLISSSKWNNQSFPAPYGPGAVRCCPVRSGAVNSHTPLQHRGPEQYLVTPVGYVPFHRGNRVSIDGIPVTHTST